MATNQSQLALVFGLIYACGVGLELLVRISQGIPRYMPPVFERNTCLVLIVFFLLPAITWPLISLYRLFAPLLRMVLGHSRQRFDSVSTVDIDLASQDRTDASHDLEKGNRL